MEELWQVEANIDDMNPQDMAYLFDRLFALGVNDAWAIPMLMKKCRMAAMLCVLCSRDQLDGVGNIIFKETTTIGFRYFPVTRQICERRVETVCIDGEDIRVKIASRQGQIMTISAEYDDCRAAAARTAVPLKEWRRKAVEEAHRRYGRNIT